MLKKLLKYDVNAIWKLWMALSVAVLGMVFAASLIIRAAIEANLADSEGLFTFFLTLGSVFLGFGAVMSWTVILTITPIMCYVRYYKNFFSDEGYLTFTLPVRRRDLYLSKVINVFLFNVGNVLVTIVAVLIALLIIPFTEGDAIVNFGAYRLIWELLVLIWEAIGGWLIVYILAAILLLAVISLYQIGMIHLCITVGATVAKKHKVLAGVGIYFGTSFILSSVSQVFGLFGLNSLVGFVMLLVTDIPSLLMIHMPILVLLLLMIVMVATAAVILHLVTLNTIERKLNLA